MKLKRKEILAMHAAIAKIGPVSSVEVSVKIAKNKIVMRPLIDAFADALDVSMGLKKYDRERVDLIDKYADRTDTGDMRVDNEGRALFSDEMKPTFKKEMEELRARHKFAFDAAKEKRFAADDFLKGEEEVDLTFIPIVEFHKAVKEIDPDVMADLLPMFSGV